MSSTQNEKSLELPLDIKTVPELTNDTLSLPAQIAIRAQNEKENIRIREKIETETKQRTNAKKFCDQLQSLLNNQNSLLNCYIIETAQTGSRILYVDQIMYNKCIPRISVEIQKSFFFYKYNTREIQLDPSYLFFDEISVPATVSGPAIVFSDYLKQELELRFPSINKSQYKIREDPNHLRLIIEF